MSPAGPVWTVGEALRWTVSYLEGKGVEQPRLSAEWLLSSATGLSRVETYAYFDRPLTSDERTVLREGVRRRAEGEPLQYVTGEMPFRHIVMRVRPGVFIPRPETEILVEEGLVFLGGIGPAGHDAGTRGPVVVDVCTGSGCVACSIAHERPDATVFATDLSADAVEIAQDNVSRLGLGDRVRVFEGDLLGPLGRDPHASAQAGRVDLVLANPPYIPTGDLDALPTEVLGHEPRLALDGGPDGLDTARRIMHEARDWLCPGGLLAMELDEGRVESAAKAMSEWYEGIRTVRDLAGRERIATGYLR